MKIFISVELTTLVFLWYPADLLKTVPYVVTLRRRWFLIYPLGLPLILKKLNIDLKYISSLFKIFPIVTVLHEPAIAKSFQYGAGLSRPVP